MINITRYVFAISLCWFVACGSIKIESGTTVAEMSDKNEIQAKQIRGDWARQLSLAENDGVRALMVKEQIDSMSSLIINYGYRVADEWRRGNTGKGEVIKDSEMRQVVEAWVVTQKPILKAYEDNMEYGIKLVHEKKNLGLVSDESAAIFDSLALHYYDTYSAVFYPNQNVENYEKGLSNSAARHKHLSDRLGLLLKGF